MFHSLVPLKKVFLVIAMPLRQPFVALKRDIQSCSTYLGIKTEEMKIGLNDNEEWYQEIITGISGEYGVVH